MPVAPPEPEPPEPTEPGFGPVETQTRTLRLVGTVPPELWNRLGTKLIPKLKSGSQLKVGIEFSVTVDGALASTLESDIRQILDDLGLTGQIRFEK